MVNKMIKLRYLFFILIIGLTLNSCYYDNVEHLYPESGDCDTSNLTYSNDVWPLINANCTSCHSGAAASGNVRLENYDQIRTAAANGQLLGTIRHESGWSPMPKGGGKLPDCDITKLEIWVELGYPNN